MAHRTAGEFPIHHRHARLMSRRMHFLAEAVERIRQVVPDATEIWCYGINAMRPETPGSDWDFIVMLPSSVAPERLELINNLSGPLSDIRSISTQTLDVQALRVDDRSSCAGLIRVEGFRLWQADHDGSAQTLPAYPRRAASQQISNHALG